MQIQPSWFFFCFLLVSAFSVSQCQNMEFNTYLKASNTGNYDRFGYSVAISGDTIVVGAWGEFSSATGVNGNQLDNSASGAGAAYVFIRIGITWVQQAYLKASNTGGIFGWSVAIYGDTVVVGAPFENSAAIGVDGDQMNTTATQAGAAYVFTRSGTTWAQQAYLKASNTRTGDEFGYYVAIYGDTVVVGARREDSNSTGVNGDQQSDTKIDAGAAYVFTRIVNTWSQQAYLKASNTDAQDQFGSSVAIYGDTIVVGSRGEDSSATGVNGNQLDNSALGAGAAYVFIRSNSTWAQQAYLKASNTRATSLFGFSVAIYGGIVVVGSVGEDSLGLGVDGNQESNAATSAGAAFVFTRNGTDNWNQHTYLKASNTGSTDYFGWSVAVFESSIIVGAPLEDSNSTEMNGDDNAGQTDSGAAYAYSLNENNVTYIKASNTGTGDQFGISVALSNSYAVICARYEASLATGINGYQLDNSGVEAGACYVYSVQRTSVESETSDLDTSDLDSGSSVHADSSEDEEEKASFVIPLTITAMLVLAVVSGISVVFFVLWRRKGANPTAAPDVPLDQMSHNVDILHNVTLKEVIGKGAFGEVWLGDCDGTPCACKKLICSDLSESIKEAKTLFKLSHPNIVTLIGIHVSPSNDTYLVLEYVKGGSLTRFLPREKKHLTLAHLADIAVGIAQGMAYLERKNIVHRDLAARNILISDSNQAMISDFGMSRDNLYQRSSTSKIPVKWSAPEVLQQEASTSKSDVFSFGVVLWEIFSFAMMPFGDLSNAEAAEIICNEGIIQKLPQPNMCPHQLYKLMIRCWSFKPSARPTFQDILAELQSINTQAPRKQSHSSSSEDHYNA